MASYTTHDWRSFVRQLEGDPDQYMEAYRFGPKSNPRIKKQNLSMMYHPFPPGIFGVVDNQGFFLADNEGNWVASS